MGLEMLQDYVGSWVIEYNEERTHSGRHCFGKTPTQKHSWILNI